jgi:GDP-L-fucose synthase
MSADRIRAMGWTPTIRLREGIAATYQWFLANAV